MPHTIPKNREAVQAMPLVAMALILLLMGGLLWLIERNEVEEERHNLIKDALWVEQALRFQIGSDEEKLRHVPEGLGVGGRQLFLDRARQVMGQDPSILRITWRDMDGKVVAALPPLAADEASPSASAALKLNSVSFSPVFQFGNRSAFDMALPAYDGGRPVGVLVATFGLQPLLDQGVPWWFVQKYGVAIRDANGSQLASKSNVAIARPGPSYQVAFDPPGYGLSIEATIHKVETNLVRNVLVVSIMVLALLAVGSLWMLRRHVRRRIAAERLVREQHAFRKAMEDSLTVGMRARDLEGRVTYVNPAFCRMVGFEADQLIGSMPPYPYWTPEDADRNLALHKAVLAGQAPADGFEIRFRRKDGSQFDALIYEAPLIDANGRHAGWMASVVDITERKRDQELWRQQQEKLQHTARLITMGELASTLAHELNQPLSAIASYNTGCLNKLQSGEFTRDELLTAMGKLSVQAARAGQIIRRVHDFVRKREPQVGECLLQDVVDTCIGFIAADAKERGVRLDYTGAAKPIRVQADVILVEQVLLNLARNGIEAMAATPAENRVLGIGIGAHDGMAFVRIADRGCGIEPTAKQGLFTPFFTTKDQGMGMGLNICRSIIEFHQGRLWYEDNRGGGSVFTFTLPLAGGDVKGEAA